MDKKEIDPDGPIDIGLEDLKMDDGYESVRFDKDCSTPHNKVLDIELTSLDDDDGFDLEKIVKDGSDIKQEPDNEKYLGLEEYIDNIRRYNDRSHTEITALIKNKKPLSNGLIKGMEDLLDKYDRFCEELEKLPDDLSKAADYMYQIVALKINYAYALHITYNDKKTQEKAYNINEDICNGLYDVMDILDEKQAEFGVNPKSNEAEKVGYLRMQRHIVYLLRQIRLNQGDILKHGLNDRDGAEKMYQEAKNLEGEHNTILKMYAF